MRSAAALATLVILAGTSSTASARQSPSSDPGVGPVIAKMVNRSPALEKVLADAAGYAVFPSIGKGAIGVGGARGKGVVYAAGKRIGRSTMTQVTIGLQLGGQAYSEVVIFKDSAALASFRGGRLKLNAQASAIALSERVGADLPYRDGVAIITMAKGGLMYEASVGGQKFSFTPDKPAPPKPQ